MEALRIKLTQNQANYRKEEAITNKMTYPLPPFSTVIGAIHKACGFTQYHPMDVSIQGRYQSMQKEPYTDYGFLNSVFDDRGILVKLRNPNLLSSAYEVVGKALKGQGNSFYHGTTIEVRNEQLLQEYRDLKDKKKVFENRKKEEIDPQLAQLSQEKKQLSTEQKKWNKKSPEFQELIEKIAEITAKRQAIETQFKKEKEQQVDIPYSYFASLTTSLRYYEVLYGVELVLHIACEDEATLDAVEAHIDQLTAIGRSEDFVDIQEVKRVTLSDHIDQEYHSPSQYSAYLDYQRVRNDEFLLGQKSGIKANGTVYHLNKNYTIVNNQRQFNKVPVVYCSNYTIDQESQGVYVDQDGYIVDLI